MERPMLEPIYRYVQAGLHARLLDAVEQAVVATDCDGTITYCNRAAEATFGCTASAMLGQPVVDVVCADAAGTSREAMRAHLRAGRSWSGELPARRWDGTSFPARIAVSPVCDDAGVHTGGIVVTTDVTERSRLVQDLDSFRTAVERASDGIAAVDTEGHILFQNRALSDLVGYTADELNAIGGPLAVYEQPSVAAGIVETVRQGVTWQGEIRLKSRTGQRLIVSLRADALRNHAGEVVGLVGVHTDVTELRGKEQALRESDRRLATLLQNLPGLAYRVRNDALWTAEFMSDGCLELTGYPPSALCEARAIHFEELIHPDDRARVRAVVEAAMIEGRSFHVRYRILTKEGEEKWVWEQGEGVPDATGAMTHIEGFITDITEYHRAEQALRASEERFRQLADAMPQLVWTAEPDGTVDYYNRRVTEYDGIRQQPDGTWAWAPVLHEEDREKTVGAWEQAVRTGQAYEIEHRVRRADGSFRWLLSRGLPVRDADGRILKWYGTATDIHEQKTTEEELRRAKVKVEEMMRVKDAFVANMSHEIRTPLTSIIGFSDILAEQATGEVRDVAHHIRSGGERLMITLNSVLELAQLESGAVELALTEVDLVDQIGQVLPLLERQAHDRGLYLELVCEEPHLHAVADRGALSRVLTNLLANAMKFTRQGGVTVHLQRTEAHAEIRVSDTGIGISETFMPRLFDEFRQESEGTARAYEGVGLGLAITKRLVTLMRGTIEVASEKGAGTTFTVRLPVPPGAAAAAGCDAEPAEPVRPRVLVVEDQDDARLLLQRLLGAAYDTATAATAEAALAVAARERFDLVLLDINLGSGVTGSDVLRALRQQPAYAQVPIVACTAYVLPGDKKRFMDAGFDAYIGKPFTRQILHSTVQMFLSRPDHTGVR